MKIDEDGRTVYPNALPNYERAVIPDDKLWKYALNPEHVPSTHGKSSGRDKSVVFESALGFNLSNWEMLKQRIIEELPYHEATIGKEDEYGTRYEVVLSILGANDRRANIVTAWIIRPNTDFASLVTLYVG